MSVININNISLNYEVCGSGKEIILLHGWGCDLSIFKQLITTLEDKFKVYAIDFPGFGKSTAPSEVWGVEEYTKLLEAFVKELNINAPILLGHSFGGRVSILYASRNKVEKLILVGSAGIKPKRPLKYYIKVYSYKLYRRFLPIFIGKSKAAEIIEKRRNKVGSADYRNSVGIMRNVLIKVVNEDLKSVMPKIAAPTLLVWGENDTATPVKDARIMEKLIKNSGLVIFKNAGHYCFIDKAYEFKLVIDSFLQST